MKLKDTTYNDKYPKFDIRKLSDEEEGISLNKSITIKVVDNYFEWEGKRISGPLLIKDIPYDNKTFRVNEMTGKIIEPEVENIRYSAYDQATFNVTDAIANAIKKDYDLEKIGGKTFKFTLVKKTGNAYDRDDEGNFNLDKDGNKQLVEKTWKTFQVEEVLPDGTTILVGEDSTPETPTPGKQSETSLPKHIQEFNKAVSNETPRGDWELPDTLKPFADELIKAGKGFTDNFGTEYNEVFVKWIRAPEQEHAGQVQYLFMKSRNISDEEINWFFKGLFDYIINELKEK